MPRRLTDWKDFTIVIILLISSNPPPYRTHTQYKILKINNKNNNKQNHQKKKLKQHGNNKDCQSTTTLKKLSFSFGHFLFICQKNKIKIREKRHRQDILFLITFYLTSLTLFALWWQWEFSCWKDLTQVWELQKSRSPKNYWKKWNLPRNFLRKIHTSFSN